MSCGKSRLIPLPPVGEGSSTSRLADELALATHFGRMAPGLSLLEVEIVAATIVNRTIVRAAGRRLEAQGQVDITLHTCARERQPDAVVVEDMVELHVPLAERAHCRRYQIRTRSFGAR